MASCFCLLLVSMMTQAAGLSTDAIQTKALLKAAAGDFGIECEYEVTTFVDPKYTETIPKQADGSIAIDLGRLLYHSDNRYRLEIVHKNLNRDTEDAIWKSRDDSKLVTYMKNRKTLAVCSDFGRERR